MEGNNNEGIVGKISFDRATPESVYSLAGLSFQLNRMEAKIDAIHKLLSSIYEMLSEIYIQR